MEWTIGGWCWHSCHASPCRIVDRQNVWGELSYRVWLPTSDVVVRVRHDELVGLDAVRPTVAHILHTAAAAKLLDALEDNLLRAPIQSSVVPLPHQIHALNRAMSQHRIRYLLADEVGLGKTIEAGLILRELKLRGMARRIWDLLLTEAVEITGATSIMQAVQWFEASMTVAKTQGDRLFSELFGEHRSRLKEDRERAKDAYDARYQAIGRIGLPAVREYRRKRLNAEHQARIAALDDAEACVPDLNAVLMFRVGAA
jgi:hypothetical protein